jgi:hypothetical protein
MIEVLWCEIQKHLIYKYLILGIGCHSSEWNLLFNYLRINYRGISLVSTTCKFISNILRSRITPYVNYIFGADLWKFHLN